MLLLQQLTDLCQAVQTQCTSDVDIQSNHRSEQYGAYHQDQTSYLTGKRKKKGANDIQINFADLALKVQNQLRDFYCCQDRNFNKCLLIISWLIFDDLNSKKSVCFFNPALRNLTKSSMAKHILDKIPVYSESSTKIRPICDKWEDLQGNYD